MSIVLPADASELDRRPGTRFKTRLLGAAQILMSKKPDDTAVIDRPAKASKALAPNEQATRSYSVKGMKLSLVRRDIYKRATRGKAA